MDLNDRYETKFYRWLFLLICLSSWKKLADSKEVRIVCYYTNWSVYRPGEAKFSPQNINPYLCTHLVYAFGGFTKENTLKPFDKYQDIEKGGYAKFTGLKTYNKNLKTLIAIGGWNEGSSRFSPMVASPERRKELVKNTVKFLRQNHFDGLDLDWEYPTFRDGGKSRDKENYAKLVKELREEFERESEKTGRSRLLLTMAVPAGIEYINKGYDVRKLMKYLDWMNILSYDYHSAFEPAVNHHAPLYALEEESEYNYDTELNIDHTIKHYLENGAIPDKLVLGIPTYGRSYTLFNPDANELGAPADGPGDMGEATRENGYLAYYEICDYVKNQDWEEVQPNEDAMGPYAFKGNQWVGYDDENIVRKKSEYVAKNDLGGIMFWAIDNDDFRGNCHGRPYPLIEAAKEALLNAYGMTDENLIAPPSKPSKTKSKSRTRTQKTTTTTEAPADISATKSSARRRRIKTKQKEEEDKIVSASSPKRRKTQKSETSSYSSLRVTTPTWTTPPPPATPDTGGAFKCEEEGFFAHPKDCKKYFWCLAGAGDSGIVAHQFTCPAGLYFNKAADSCDYTQNVLCNKKVLKTTTTAKTTTTEESDSDSSTTSTTLKSSILSGLFSTTRPPPKITAATSRTTFLSRTTTEVAEEEYDDEEYEDEEETDKKSSEEDPKVIKELIELIRKAGGIDQLEKHLKIGGSQGANKPDSTTQSGLSKSLYERVLSKTSKSTLNALRKNTGTTRNSAGPQDEGLSSNDKKPSTSEKGRLQYQNIARKRPTTEKSIDEETKNEYVSQDKEKDKSTKAKNSLEYVNIRRPKSGPSTTEANEENEDSNFSRNKILGESSDKQTNNSEEEPLETNRKSNNVPQYVNIRRQRPSTEGGVVEEKESSTTSKYVSIRRSTTPATFDKGEEQKDSEKSTKGSTLKTGDELFKTTRYQTISRTSTTPSVNEAKGDLEETRRSTPNSVTEDNSDSKYQVISRSTNTSPTAASPIPEKNDVPEQNTITKLDEENISSSSTEEPPITSTAQEKSQNNLESSSEPVKDTKRPSLFRPRPFSTGSSSTTTESAVEATKVSQSNIKFRLRQPSTSTSTEGTLINVRSRIRGSSRFSGSNANDVQPENIAEEKQQVQSTRTRKRVIVTTESNIDYNLEQNRKYRPAELADLSSLTAADINLRGVDFQLRNRRRRPIALTTTTQEPVEGLKKTETLPRKSTNFVNRRRAALKSDDQQNASSELSSTARPNRFFRTTTTKPDDEILESKTSQQVSNLTPRPRKIIRRLRPGSTASLSTTEATISNEISSTTNSAALKRKRISVFRTRKTTAQANGTILDTINAVTDTDGPPFFTSRLPFSNQNATKQEEQVEPHVDILNAEEGENIKLSESNIRERSQLNSFAVDKKSGKSKLGSEKFFKGANKEDTQSLEIEGFRVTEAPSFFRTRKIVKKLSTTEPSIDKATITENTRRKIIRRLRPSNQNSFDEKSKDELLNLNKKTKYENEEEKFKENDFSVLLPSSTVQTTETPITRFSHRLSLYTRTTSTTPKNEDDKEDIDVLIEEGDDEEGDDEEGDDEKDKQNQSEERDSKYRIYTSSTVNQTHHFESKVNFNNEMESNFNDGWKENKSMTSAVSKMAVNERNESEMILDTDEQLLNNGKDSEDATKKPLVYKEIERPSYRENVLISKEKTQENIQQDSFKSEPGRIITTTSKTEEATTDFNLEATTILVDLVNNAAKEKINEITPNDLFLPETSTEIPNEEQNIEINEKQVEVTEKSTSEATQSTTEYTKRSTLRSVQSRPRFGHRKTTDASSVVKSSNIETSSKRNRIFGRGRPTTLRPARPVTLIANRATTPRSSNRFIKKYSSTERSRFRTTEKEVDDEIVDKDTDEQNLENFSSTETNSLSNRRKFGNSPVGIRISTTKLPRIFSKSTESSTAAEDLGIDTEAVKNRNKNLFSKRKMNTPYVPTSTVSVLPEESSSFDKNIGNTTVDFESTTLGSQPMETTDYLTTLHHIFAEVEGGNTNILDSSTETMEPSKTPSNSKVERLIEVNRIVEVSAKEHKIKNHEVEEQTRVETIPTLDRIGEITRITVIKVVDGNNKTVVENLENNEISNKSEVSLEANELLHAAKIEEIPNPLSGQSVNLMNSDFDISLASSNREERKFEIFGGSKVSNDKTAAAFPEIIDGRSHINVITSRPFINSETSTISLESLFVSEKGHLNPSFSNIDEILETDKSEFVNVRVLNDKKIDKVPIIQTLDDEDATIQAQVLEVTQKPNARTFKIVPIRVETAKNVAVSN